MQLLIQKLLWKTPCINTRECEFFLYSYSLLALLPGLHPEGEFVLRESTSPSLLLVLISAASFLADMVSGIFFKKNICQIFVCQFQNSPVLHELVPEVPPGEDPGGEVIPEEVAAGGTLKDLKKKGGLCSTQFLSKKIKGLFFLPVCHIMCDLADCERGENPLRRSRRFT